MKGNISSIGLCNQFPLKSKSKPTIGFTKCSLSILIKQKFGCLKLIIELILLLKFLITNFKNLNSFELINYLTKQFICLSLIYYLPHCFGSNKSPSKFFLYLTNVIILNSRGKSMSVLFLFKN